ncbi:hypothetical protein V1264_020123 [Littorina saxatilis]|uniref:Fucolectin-related molecule n=1 Tax=Littorina saxatilis TaxID=31220 RepID=A0AAN9BB12_9CAEN
MSSQYYWPNNTHPPGAAVNGNTGGKHYREDNCIHTAGNDTAPWWEVDLGRMYPVHRIVVWARTVEIHRMTGCIIYVDGKECYRFGYTEPETVEYTETLHSALKIETGSTVAPPRGNM